jgi:hypothetical protein
VPTLEAEGLPPETSPKPAPDIELDVEAVAAPIDASTEVGPEEEVDPDFDVEAEEDEAVDAANAGTINLLYDLGVYLQASQSHVNPTQTKVAKLIAYELREAKDSLSHGNLELQLTVGDEPIEAKQANRDKSEQLQTIVLQPGTELRIAGAENEEVIAELDSIPVRLAIDAVARAFVGSGKLVDQTYGDVYKILREEGRKEYAGEPKPVVAPAVAKILAASTAPETEPDADGDERGEIEATDEDQAVVDGYNDEPEPEEPAEVALEKEPEPEEPDEEPAPPESADVILEDDIPEPAGAETRIPEPASLESRRATLTELIRNKGQAKPSSSETDLYADASQVTWMHPNGRMCSIYLAKNKGGSKITFTVPLQFKEAEGTPTNKPAMGTQPARWAIHFHDIELADQTFFLHGRRGKIGTCIQPGTEDYNYDFHDEYAAVATLEERLAAIFGDNKARLL